MKLETVIVRLSLTFAKISYFYSRIVGKIKPKNPNHDRQIVGKNLSNDRRIIGKKMIVGSLLKMIVGSSVNSNMNFKDDRRTSDHRIVGKFQI